jgi:hypothetical protein
MTWQVALVDSVTLLVVGTLIYLKAIPSEIGVPLIAAVVAARAALAKPPNDGGGGAISGSAAGALGLGVLSLLGMVKK